jgi:glycosyltransferase involved in cell wall biosynthesis
MRVLHLIKGLGPGGAERLVVSLTACRSGDVDVDVAYLLPHKSHLVAELKRAGASTHLLAGERGLADWQWPIRLIRLVKRTRPDIVHLHSPALAGPARIVLRTLRHRPAIISTEHNVWASFGRSTRWANALTVPLDDERLAVSEEVRTSSWARYQPRTHVVVHGVPLAALQARRTERAAARQRLGVEDTEVLVITVANFREKKDYPTLLAAAAACAAHPSLRFVAIGQGPLEGAMHAEHERLGLGERFRFLGYQADPAGLLVGADVFALTSRHEGLPISLLEAMALGVPPVVSAVGGVPEVVTHGIDGLLLPPGDPAAFADAFLRLADNRDERTALGRAAARRANDFDITRTQRDLEARYRKLLIRRGR